MGECEPRNFLQPCLLLLLRERSDHGYDLVNRLRVLHAVDGDAGAVYRALRGLEKQGMVRSTWQTSDAGPARRTYQVTQLGLATLDRQAYILEETHRTLHLFRERYRHLAGLAGSVGANGGPGVGVGGANGTNGVGSSGHSATGNGGSGNGGSGHASIGNADAVNGGNGSRRDGNGSTTAGGAHGEPGGRGVRPTRLPGQRAGD